MLLDYVQPETLFVNARHLEFHAATDYNDTLTNLQQFTSTGLISGISEPPTIS
jgi:hypothetical protein